MNKSPRHARLMLDHQRLQDLSSRSKYISVESFGNPPETHIITYTCTGLYLDAQTDEVRRSNFHQMEIVFSPEYPIRKPAIRWLTPVFHPNIYESGQICIYDIWEANRDIAQFVVDIGELVQYKKFNIYNPVNRKAAQWTAKNLHILPIGRENLLETETQSEQSRVQVIVSDFIGTVLQGDSNVVYSITQGPKSDEIKEITRILSEMLALVSSQNALKQEAKQDYAIEASNLKNEISKSKPNVSRIREMLAFLGDVEGTLGLATRLAPYILLLQPLIQKIIG